MNKSTLQNILFHHHSFDKMEFLYHYHYHQRAKSNRDSINQRGLLVVAHVLNQNLLKISSMVNYNMDNEELFPLFQLLVSYMIYLQDILLHEFFS